MNEIVIAGAALAAVAVVAWVMRGAIARAGLNAMQEKLAGFNRQALHAAQLSFVHPVSGTLLEFNSPLPEDFAMIVQALKEL